MSDSDEYDDHEAPDELKRPRHAPPATCVLLEALRVQDYRDVLFASFTTPLLHTLRLNTELRAFVDARLEVAGVSAADVAAGVHMAVLHDQVKHKRRVVPLAAGQYALLGDWADPNHVEQRQVTTRSGRSSSGPRVWRRGFGPLELADGVTLVGAPRAGEDSAEPPLVGGWPRAALTQGILEVQASCVKLEGLHFERGLVVLARPETPRNHGSGKIHGIEYGGEEIGSEDDHTSDEETSWHSAGSVAATDCTFGGQVIALKASALSLEDCTIAGCPKAHPLEKKSQGAAALSCHGANVSATRLTIEDCEFDAVGVFTAAAKARFVDCTVQRCGGVAVHCYRGSTTRIAGSTLQENAVALLVSQSGKATTTVSLVRCVIRKNRGGDDTFVNAVAVSIESASDDPAARPAVVFKECRITHASAAIEGPARFVSSTVQVEGAAAITLVDATDGVEAE